MQPEKSEQPEHPRPRFWVFFVLLFTQVTLIDLRLQSYLEIDRELEPYVMSFHREALERSCEVELLDIVVVFGRALDQDSKSEVLGTCETGTSIRQVTISPKYWEIASQDDRESLVYHELGHCLLGRDHLDGVYPSGAPVSIMHSYLEIPISERRQEYLTELFSTCVVE